MSNYDRYFPIRITERPLRFPSNETSAALLLRQELERVFKDHRGQTDRILGSVGQVCFQLGRVRDESPEAEDQTMASTAEGLEIIIGNLQELLEDYQVQVEDLTGCRWTAELRDAVDVHGHQIRKDLNEPRIAYMELPIVRRNGRVIARGAAIVEAPKHD